MAILLFGFVNYSCQRRQIADIDSQGKNIICFGDSLTFGYSVEPQQSYPSLLSRMLKREVINVGRSGDTVAMALERLEKDVLENEPLLVIIILGANDFLQGVPQERTFNDLKSIIRRIKSKRAMVALGELGPFNMYVYKDEYKKLARAENVLLIKDILSGIFAQPDFMSDEVHPNSKGYAKIAEKVYKAILPIIDENKRLRVK